LPAQAVRLSIPSKKHNTSSYLIAIKFLSCAEFRRWPISH
jgi:hypothetical protein